MRTICQLCTDGWRFETTKLSGPDAGQVTGVLHPVAAQWEEGYSRPATGSLTLAVRDVSAEQVWPDTGFYISQVLPDGSRRGRFGGYFDKNNGAGGGALTVALISIDGFLDERLLCGPNDPYYLFAQDSNPGFPQFIVQKPIPGETKDTVYQSPITPGGIEGGTSAVAAFLVTLAQGGIEGPPETGIPTLTGTWELPTTTIGPGPLKYEWWDFKNIGQLIRELVEAEDGIKYRLEHTYSDGFWTTEMVFSDVIGVDRDYTLKSDREGQAYALEVDGSDKASRVYGVGSGEEWNTQYSIAYDAGRDADYPERQATIAWKDQTSPTILDSQTRGYVSDHRDPTTVPSMTLVGMPGYDPNAAGYDPQRGFPAPEICRPGDTFLVDIGYGAITVKDIRVRNLGVAWSLKEGAPVERTIAMQPIVRPSLSIRTQTPAKPPAPTQPVPTTPTPVTSDPWPTPGKLVNIFSPSLDEVSGMEVSRANPGHVWVHNDETETKQVHLVNLKTGGRAATFGLSPGVSPSPVGDPEAIRLSRKTGRLVLADIGDNALNRPTSGTNQPHLLAVPEPKGGGDKGILSAVRYPIQYPAGQQVNCETLLIHPTTDQVFLVSKETNRTRVFGFGALSAMSTANNVGTLVATLTTAPYQVTDGTHSWDGKYVFFRVAGNTATIVYDAVTWKKLGFIQAPAMSKSEAIAVESSCSFLTTTEGVNPPIYRVLIPKTFGATCSTPAGGGGTGGQPSTNPNATVPGQLIPMTNWKLQLPID